MVSRSPLVLSNAFKESFTYCATSPNCDLAYYCNQCGRKDTAESIGVLSSDSRKTCSIGPGRSIPCDEAKKLEALGYKVFEFGHQDIEV